jgi:hypothetical protein
MMNKFKVGDKVFNSTSKATGSISDILNSVVIKVVWDDEYKNIMSEYAIESWLQLVEPKEDTMEYNWHEAIEMVTGDYSIGMESKEYVGELCYDNIDMCIVLKIRENKLVPLFYNELLFKSMWTIVKPQTDWSKVAVDTKIVVSGYGFKNNKGYFSRFENGKVYAFHAGCTSFTSNGVDMEWEYAELYQE